MQKKYFLEQFYTNFQIKIKQCFVSDTFLVFESKSRWYYCK